MSSFGVLSTGFVTKTTQDILDDIEAAEKLAFGSQFDVSADAPAGQLNGVFAAALAEAWQSLAAVYNAVDPAQSGGQALDRLSAITGTTRLAASQSTATLTVTGVPTTVLTAGRVVSHVDSEERFATDALATIVATAAWAATTTYVLGDRVTNSGNVYVCVVAGTSAGAGGPTGTGDVIVDGTVTWRFVGVGTGDADVDVTAENFGPVEAPSGALTVIETPVGGWNGARNLEDATPGRALETDAALRVRRTDRLRAEGKAALDAIRTELLDVIDADGNPLALAVFMYENASEFTDADGRPPHSIEAVIREANPGDAASEQALADALFEAKAGGIETFGFPGQIVTESVVDDQGDAHTINYTTVLDVDIYIEIEVTVDPALYPLDGDDQVKQALVDAGNVLTAGEDVIAEKNKCQAFEVSGVIDITAYRIGTAPSPTLGDNIPITDREQADFDTSRVIVVAT